MVTPPILTDGGRGLLLRAIGGEKVSFTKFGIGNGNPPQPYQLLTALGNSCHTFGISEASTDDGYLSLKGTFDSSDLSAEFRWTELGVYAKGEDNIEILYAYANDGDNAGMLKTETAGVETEHTVSIVISIGDAENISVILSGSAVYASKEDLDAHKNNTSNPHNVTKTQLGLGNVENEAVNDMTPDFTEAETLTAPVTGEKFSVILGKIKRLFTSYSGHLNANNPHSITLSKIGAAASSHTHSTAQITSGILPLERGGTGQSSCDPIIEHSIQKKSDWTFVITKYASGFCDVDGMRAEVSYRIEDPTHGSSYQCGGPSIPFPSNLVIEIYSMLYSFLPTGDYYCAIEGGKAFYSGGYVHRFAGPFLVRSSIQTVPGCVCFKLKGRWK